MEYLEFHKNIQQIPSSPLYVVVGPEKFLRREVISMLHKKYGGDDIFYKEYLGDNAYQWDSVWNDLYSQALFESFSMIVLREVDKLISKIQDNILAYLKEPPQTACLVLEFEKIDQRLKFGQTLKKKGVLIQCNPLKEESWKSKNRLSELAEWIHLRAEHYQKKIHPDAVQMLCELIGNDLQEIDLHLEKISDKFPNKKEIRPEDLKNAVQNTKKVNVFDFLDTIFSENKQKAFAMSCQLFEKGLVGQDGKNISGSTEITLQILRLIHYRIRQLWQIGVSRDTASISDFIQRKMKPQAERFSATRLKYIWQKTLETEIAIKVEQVSPELALEKLLNSICSKNVS